MNEKRPALAHFKPSVFTISVTRLGDLLDFGQLFKVFAINLFVQISHILSKFL